MISKHPILNFLEEVFLHSWWVILIAILCYMWTENETKKQEETFHALSSHVIELKNEKMLAQSRQELLLKQINSQSDPSWVELALIKGLGLVPEDHTKIFFSKSKE